METLAKSGTQMPVAVQQALDKAIDLRDEANAFYKDMQADLEQLLQQREQMRAQAHAAASSHL